MPESPYYGLILAGGRGTRFWPLSRRRTPKQVLTITGERSLIQATVDRLRVVIEPRHMWILTNAFVRDEIVRQLPEVPAEQILAEPAQRNTAPAIGLAARIIETLDPEAVMGVFPSDHVITDTETYAGLLRTAFQAAESGSIVVLGIRPRWAETGYGYVEFAEGAVAGSVSDVKSFREKPDAATAARYVESGNFFWNAGMFFWKARVVMENLRQHLPVTAALLDGLPHFDSPHFAPKLAEAFPGSENISIDYAVLEKARGVVGVPCPEFGWNDVGSWEAVYDLLPHDADGNASRSALLPSDSGGNFVEAGGKLVALLGVDDLIIVDTPDALLIARRDRSQEVGELVKLLERQKREELL
jgi:mannose-1-phosphate guanylyltransferase